MIPRGRARQSAFAVAAAIAVGLTLSGCSDAKQTPTPTVDPCATPAPTPTVDPRLPPMEKRVAVIGIETTAGYARPVLDDFVEGFLKILPDCVYRGSPGLTIFVRRITADSYSAANHVAKIFCPRMQLEPVEPKLDLGTCEGKDLLANLECERRQQKEFETAQTNYAREKRCLDLAVRDAKQTVQQVAERLRQLPSSHASGPADVLGFLANAGVLFNENEASSRSLLMASAMPFDRDRMNRYVNLTGTLPRIWFDCAAGFDQCEERKKVWGEAFPKWGACPPRFLNPAQGIDQEVFTPLWREPQGPKC